MSQCTGLCHFRRSVSRISQWTGTEHKEMEKVFLEIISGGVRQDVLTAAHTMMDFIFLTQYQCHTSWTLNMMEWSVTQFHEHKVIFISKWIWKHFNIPKLHSIIHYIDLIKKLGSPDGYNTELPEQLHINLAKDGFCVSNKFDAIEQMALWLQWREATWIRDTYLAWRDSPLHNKRPDKSEEEGGKDKPSVINKAAALRTINKPTLPHRIASTPVFQNVTMEHLAMDSVLWISMWH